MMTQPCEPPSTSLACGYHSLRNLKAMVYLASPGFWSDLRSGREPERLHLIAVLSFDDEFREDVA
jgi:hypothetical protein